MKKFRTLPALSASAAAPVYFLFVLWPCVVHMDVSQTHLQSKPWFPDVSVQGDIFMHMRSAFLYVFTLLLIILLMDRFFLRGEKRPALSLLLPLGGYAVCAVISSAVSVDYTFSFMGASQQYETIWSLLSQIIICMYFFIGVDGGWLSFDTVVRAALVGAALQSSIGLSQMAGHDFWSTAIGRGLILLGCKEETALTYTFADAGGGRVYLSFYNPNYAAMYLILVLPFAAAAVFSLKDLWEKGAAAVLTACLLICLYGTGSMAGFAAAVFLFLVAGLLYLRRLRGRLVFLAAFFLALLVWIAADIAMPGEGVWESLRQAVFPEQKFYKLQNVKLLENSVRITFDGEEYDLTIIQEEGQAYFAVLDAEGRELPLEQDPETGHFTLKAPHYRRFSFEAWREEGVSYIVMYRMDIPWQFEKSEDDGTYVYRNVYGKTDTPKNAPYAFGKGYERAFSKRVYIWSRTLMLLPEYLLLGSGPNTFALVFPQNDYVVRANLGEDMLTQIITRPHSMYLQTALQTGLLSLFFLVLFWAGYLSRGIRELSMTGRREGETERNAGRRVWQMACILSAGGYLVMGTTNDSLLVVSPLFWALAGSGFAWIQAGRPRKNKVYFRRAPANIKRRRK